MEDTVGEVMEKPMDLDADRLWEAFKRSAPPGVLKLFAKPQDEEPVEEVTKDE
jgi:hypothetical protein